MLKNILLWRWQTITAYNSCEVYIKCFDKIFLNAHYNIPYWILQVSILNWKYCKYSWSIAPNRSIKFLSSFFNFKRHLYIFHCVSCIETQLSIRKSSCRYKTVYEPDENQCRQNFKNLFTLFWCNMKCSLSIYFLRRLSLLERDKVVFYALCAESSQMYIYFNESVVVIELIFVFIWSAQMVGHYNIL